MSEKSVTLWINYGCEGWKPQEFSSLKDALLATNGDTFRITRDINFEVKEAPLAPEKDKANG